MPASSDGVVSTTLLSDGTTQRIVVDFSVAGSPIAGTVGNVSTVTVTEQTSNYTVRSLTGVYAPGGSAVGVDHEALFSASLSYVARAYNPAGTLLGTSTAAAVTTPTPVAGSWLKSLATPSLSQSFKTATEPEWSADITQAVIQVIGRPDPIVVQDVRQYESGTIEVYTSTAAGEAAMLALLAAPGPYLLQQPGHGSSDKYVTVGKYTRKRTTNRAGDLWRVWTLPVQRVARPDPLGWQVADPGRTYADSTAAYPLYSNRTGTYLAKS